VVAHDDHGVLWQVDGFPSNEGFWSKSSQSAQRGRSMPSKMGPEAQIIVRCLGHVPVRNVAWPYVAYAHPAGDGLALICGRGGCGEPGVVMLTAAAQEAFNEGNRVYYPRTATVRIRVGNAIFTLR